MSVEIPPATPTRTLDGWKLGAWVLMVIFATTFSITSIMRHEAFRSGLYDLGLFEQILWNLSRGYGFQSSVSGGSFLGNHLSFTLILLAPIYGVFTSTWTLLILQAVIVGLGGLPAFEFARRKLSDNALALSATAVYLSLPALGHPMLFDFHMEPLGATALMFAIDAMDQQKWRPTLIWLGLALLTKEEIALVVAMFGVLIALKHRQWWLGAGISGVALAYFVIGVQWLLPTFGGYGSEFTGNLARYSHLGESFPAIARTSLTRPVYALTTSFTPLKQENLIALGVSVLFLPLLGPMYLLLALPILAINYLSSSFAQFNVLFQYLTLALPGLFAAMIAGISNLRGWLKFIPARAFSIAMTGVLVLGSAYSIYKQVDYHTVRQTFLLHPQTAANREALALIPPHVSVAATNFTAPHAAARHELYYSVPFIYEVGRGILSYPDTDYILITLDDVFARPEELAYRLEVLRASPDYRTAFERDGVILFCRKSICGDQ